MTGISLFSTTFSGATTASSISVPGVKEGDRVLQFYRPTGNVVFGLFEQTVSQDDEILQISEDDLSALEMTAVIYRTL